MAVAVCPGCSKKRDVDKQAALRAVEATWFREPRGWPQPQEDDMRHLATQQLSAGRGRHTFFWACDECVNSGRAISADVTKVNISIGTPYAAYVDRPFRCDDCKAEAVFSAAEQHHWFETLGFLIWVYPKQCTACRKKRRTMKQAHKALADALANLDSKDATQLDAVAKLYDEIGSAPKAKSFRARAKNRRRSPT